ncbi:MAG TPA: ATP-binding protein [Usitatibacter sp.]|nr:ATP-binding protein [Usitatibacter sp.]
MRASFFHGIRFRLALVALALLALPLLAVHYIASMEAFLRESQERSIGATARTVAAALSDRPTLFERGAGIDEEGEERRRIVALFAAADTDAAASLGNAYVPSEEIERFLAIMGRVGERVWVVDARSRVRGLSGSLRDPRAARTLVNWLKPVAALVVPAPRYPVGDETLPVRSQIDRALIGVSSAQWRATRDRDVAILSAAQPIFIGDDIVGAVVVEETTGAIQILRQDALEKLLAVTLAVVGAALAILLAFAGRLAARIRRLHAEAEAAIDSQGRVRGAISASSARDEIGDLSRTTAAMLTRLRDYNAYLEAMAGRLSHELRTPVAVVRSSLDNLAAEPLAGNARVYVERALEGVRRLARLISRLSEATRLERLLESAERERFDLAEVVRGCVEGYRAAYPERAFELALPAAAVPVDGVPDAFAQLLDKLVENANDFAPPGTGVRVSLEAAGERAALAVENDGPPLPEAMMQRLFDSMVSVRRAAEQAGAREDGAHLGLGLYIVRLVAEHHGGSVRAANREGGGVRFEVEIALARDTRGAAPVSPSKK